MLTRNVGTADRMVRGALAVALAVLSVVVWGPGSAAGIVALVVAGVAMLTASSGYCPIYRLLHLSTARVGSDSPSHMNAAHS